MSAADAAIATDAATEKEAAIRRKIAGVRLLKADLPRYARECLKIKTKSGAIVPLVFNRAQMFLHERIEAHRAKRGRVRIVLGKGRQTGGSTYVGARFYHKTTLTSGINTYILTHEQEATNNLFDMVERFHRHCPLTPSTTVNSAKELYFDKLDSGYSVGTAGTKAAGRSRTIQLLHWSEEGFSPNAAGHQAGIVQTVPDLPGTEIIKESTGNGPWGLFYEEWQQAEAGIGDYEAIFIPWYWCEDYERGVPEGFALDEEEAEYKRLYSLTVGQMVWRRAKIAELKDPKLFRQEYPASALEMFQATGRQSYIDPELVVAARKQTCEGLGPLVVGVDPARFGDDRFSVAWRKGRRVFAIESRAKLGTTEAIAWLKDIIDQDRPAKMFIDSGGGGDRLYDVLVSWGEPYSDVISLVNFGSAPLTETIVLRDGTKRAGPANRRAEMWMRSLEWLSQTGGADVPDIDSLQADAAAPGFTYRTTDQRLLLESKEQIRARGVRSPDEWDAIALTFAEPVFERRPRPAPRAQYQQASSAPNTSWLGL
jgi:hypothetical protein